MRPNVDSLQVRHNPLYAQVADRLRGRILAGNYDNAGALPNERDLSLEFGVSLGTVRKAVDLLQSRRVVIRRQGRGTFVNPRAAQPTIEFAFTCGVAQEPYTISASSSEQEVLAIDARATRWHARTCVTLVHRLHRHGDCLLGEEHILVPIAQRDAFAQPLDLTRHDLVDHLLRSLKAVDILIRPDMLGQSSETLTYQCHGLDRDGRVLMRAVLHCARGVTCAVKASLG
jgi:DNA-binding GntR family transcriptional regulator